MMNIHEKVFLKYIIRFMYLLSILIKNIFECTSWDVNSHLDYWISLFTSPNKNELAWLQLVPNSAERIPCYPTMFIFAIKQLIFNFGFAVKSAAHSLRSSEQNLLVAPHTRAFIVLFIVVMIKDQFELIKNYNNWVNCQNCNYYFSFYLNF